MLPCRYCRHTASLLDCRELAEASLSSCRPQSTHFQGLQVCEGSTERSSPTSEYALLFAVAHRPAGRVPATRELSSCSRCLVV